MCVWACRRILTNTYQFTTFHLRPISFLVFSDVIQIPTIIEHYAKIAAFYIKLYGISSAHQSVTTGPNITRLADLLYWRFQKYRSYFLCCCPGTHTCIFPLGGGETLCIFTNSIHWIFLLVTCSIHLKDSFKKLSYCFLRFYCEESPLP